MDACAVQQNQAGRDLAGNRDGRSAGIFRMIRVKQADFRGAMVKEGQIRGLGSGQGGRYSPAVLERRR